ncbi:MAG: hypothetical protein R3336_08900 [Phycisphaeraceae bacterium]|nr:hypothetical protein [Phycisphaeraceae bacterium]
MARDMLTTDEGPVVVSRRTLEALLAIRRGHLLPKIYPDRSIMIDQECGEQVEDRPDFIELKVAPEDVELPTRIGHGDPCDLACLRLALHVGASMVMLEDPIKERAKLSFIRAEGTVPFLVQAHRAGHLTAVEPMIKALRALGHEDVLPPEDQLAALKEALRHLGEG